ncbi:hypothetical protein QN277_024793 [Acacia crassicarpa]|uniref:Uncharacterized protein n=1 Tax=Acacia crassicarpa TaxID=499986 RepID=A0AAE1MJX4_9FABA|nr:hypothetical protein QN277_024793 [Acacia crassicarpa]
MSSQVDDNMASGSASGVERISKKGIVMKCSVCKSAGHNRSTCKEAPPESNPVPRRKKPHAQSSQQQASSTSHAPNPAAYAQQTPIPSESGNLSTKRRRCHRPSMPMGFGIMVDEGSGRSVFNPGLRSEKVIEHGTPAEFMHTPSPTTKFPIPNEKEIRKSSVAIPSSQDGSRKIQFTSPSYTDSSLPVKPPGLRWKGQPSISSS